MAINRRFRVPRVRARRRCALAWHHLRILSVAVMLVAGFPLARAQRPTRPRQRVTVRFLDPRSGKPIRKMWVGVTQWKDEPPKEESNVPYILGNTNAQTNRSGEVVFTLSDPPPMFVSVHSFDLWYSGNLIPTSKVLESGVVFDYSDAKPPRGYWVNKQGQPVMKSGSLFPDGQKPKKGVSKLKVSAKPGEIIFVERKITRWQWFLQELP